MPIAALDAFPVSYPEPNDHGRNRAVCLVRLTDGDGRTGWGECTTYWPEAAVAAAVLVEALRDHVVGKDAVQNESIMRGLRAQTWWYGTGGVGIAGFALSGIDVALWDLKGKTLGARVLDLLGGPAHDTPPGHRVEPCDGHRDPGDGGGDRRLAGDRAHRRQGRRSASSATPTSASSTTATWPG